MQRLIFCCFFVVLEAFFIIIRKIEIKTRFFLCKWEDVNRLYNTYLQLDCGICACSSTRQMDNNNLHTSGHWHSLTHSAPIQLNAAYMLQGNYNIPCPYNNCTELLWIMLFFFYPTFGWLFFLYSLLFSFSQCLRSLLLSWVHTVCFTL